MLQQDSSSEAPLGWRACIGQHGVASERRFVAKPTERAAAGGCCRDCIASSEHCGARHIKAANEGSDHSTAQSANAMANRIRNNPPSFILIRVHPEARPGQGVSD